jgi:hypothetical protein
MSRERFIAFLAPPAQDERHEAFLVIDNKDDGAFLYGFNSAGKCLGDTCVDDAFAQASFQFAVQPSSWEVASGDLDDIVRVASSRVAR